MRLAGALAVLLAGAVSAEPTRQLPKGLHATPIQHGTAYLVTDGRPDDASTALPSGWYFTAEGYDRLNTATVNLQAAVKELEAKRGVWAPCPEVAPMPPLTVEAKGWSTQAVIIALLAGLMVGAGGALVLSR